MTAHSHTLHTRRMLRRGVSLYVKRAIMEHFDEDEFKRLTKQAIKEWLDEQFAAFGRWTALGVAAAALAGIVTFILWSKGLGR